MADADLVLTRHAEDMLSERNIKRAWVEAAIRNPDVLEQDPHRPGVMRAFRSIPERDDRMLRVAYVSDGSSCRVLTVFFDRRRRPKTRI
jgi:hypothetical protein